jgi:chaperonin GroES
MAKIRPLGDKILVERLEADSKTKGGIFLPDTAKEKPKEGRVLAVGDGRMLDDGTRVKFTVKEGDRIIFASFAGTEVKHDGKDLLLLSEEDVLAVVD